MNKKSLAVWIAAALLALAALLGLSRRGDNPFTLGVAHAPEARSASGGVTGGGRAALREHAPTTASVTFLHVGDIMLSRNVAATVKKAGDPFLPFSKLQDLLASTDFNVGNLESPISGTDFFPATGSMVFNAPRFTLPGLVRYNFGVLNLANNHALDQGPAGVSTTIAYLDEHGIDHTGVGENLEQAWAPALTEAGGIRIAFVGASYASVNDGGRARNRYVARTEDTDRLNSAVAAARRAADFVVVTFHAGTEYTTNPNPDQVAFARAAVNAGADLVVGHHPHWVQTIERYRGRYIFYSLGNFIFDQMFSAETRQGLAIKVTVTKPLSAVGLPDPSRGAKLAGIELVPLTIDNYSTPRLASSSEAAVLFSRIGEATTSLPELLK